jgi:hypothetical protein
MTDDGEPRVHEMHRGARRVLTAGGCLIMFLPPIGIYYFLRARHARVEVSAREIVERSLLRTHARLQPDDATRLGVLVVPLPGGIGGAGARVKVRGDAGVNLCWKDGRGRTRSILVSMYEEPDAILAAAQQLTGLPLEHLEMGFWGVRWPERD